MYYYFARIHANNPFIQSFLHFSNLAQGLLITLQSGRKVRRPAPVFTSVAWKCGSARFTTGNRPQLIRGSFKGRLRVMVRSPSTCRLIIGRAGWKRDKQIAFRAVRTEPRPVKRGPLRGCAGEWWRRCIVGRPVSRVTSRIGDPADRLLSAVRRSAETFLLPHTLIRDSKTDLSFHLSNGGHLHDPITPLHCRT